MLPNKIAHTFLQLWLSSCKARATSLLWKPNIFVSINLDRSIFLSVHESVLPASYIQLIQVDDYVLTHWSRVMHICISKLTIIDSDNGLLPGRCQAIIWNQWWNVVNFNLRNKFQWNLKWNSHIFIHKNAFENALCEMAIILPRTQCVKWQPLQTFTFFSGWDTNSGVPL